MLLVLRDVRLAARRCDIDPHQPVPRKLRAGRRILLDHKAGLLLAVAKAALKPRAQPRPADRLRRLPGAQPDMISYPQQALHGRAAGARGRGRAG